MAKCFLVVPCALGIAAAASAADPAAAKVDLAKAQQIATTLCAACHGADGNSTAPANPKLAGQIPEYTAKQLRNFRAPDSSPEQRKNAIMTGIAATLSDADMHSLGDFFAGQKLVPEKAIGDKNSINLGQQIWRAGDASKGLPACAGCHGPSGSGIPAQYPRLSGQYAAYTEAQLKAFRLAERANDPNRMMRLVAVKMTDAEIKAVADYIAGLR